MGRGIAAAGKGPGASGPDWATLVQLVVAAAGRCGRTVAGGRAGPAATPVRVDAELHRPLSGSIDKLRAAGQFGISGLAAMAASVQHRLHDVHHPSGVADSRRPPAVVPELRVPTGNRVVADAWS